MSEEEAIERGMIPGLELKRFEKVARRLQALEKVGLSIERGQQLGLVEADVMEVYENFLAQFETLETLGMSYEEGVQMGFIQDGVQSKGISSLELQKAPGAEGLHCSGLADLELPKAASTHTASSTMAPSVASSLPSRQDSVHDPKKVPALARAQRSGFTFRVGPEGVSCACGGPPRCLDEHEVEEA